MLFKKTGELMKQETNCMHIKKKTIEAINKKEYKVNSYRQNKIMKRLLLIGLICASVSIGFGQTNSDAAKTFEFTVEGMSCSGCAQTATKTLQKLNGVQKASVDFNSKKAQVMADSSLTERQIKDAIKSVGFEAMFTGDSLIHPLTSEEKAGLDIRVIKGGSKINIKEHLSAGKITIFDFYADWCVPCRVFSPKVERLPLEYPIVAVKKVDIVDWKSELSKQLTKEYQMPALPFILIFDDKGKLLGRVEGNYIEQVEEIIKHYLK